jgi:osmoprotectant transport system permease protein
MIGFGALLAAAGPVIPNFAKGSACIVQNRQFCASWFFDNFSSRFLPRVVEHLQLTGIAVGIGAVIAFTAAILAYKQGWFETPFSLFAAFLYTIPSLAFFELMVPITGINRFSAEIALVSYTLLILFRNTLTGLRNVPAEIRDAARGMGMGPMRTLLRVELPLALPAIIAGVRIATVTVISLATVAALVDNEGLGVPILTAISNEVFKTELIMAGGMAVLLALFADGLLVLLQRFLTPWARAG